MAARMRARRDNSSELRLRSDSVLRALTRAAIPAQRQTEVFMKCCLLWFALLAGVLMGCARHKYAHELTPYQFPLNSPGGKFTGLPPAVQNSIRAQVGEEEIEDIRKLNYISGDVVYEVDFVNDVLYPPLFVAADGAVLNPDMTVAVGTADDTIGVSKGAARAGLKPGDLPKQVMQKIQEKAPTNEIAFATKEVRGDREVYIIDFKDPIKNPPLEISDDGTILQVLPP
jgi:hypothetical protein